jgi:hypoxanthine phosphoribosyltransferase
MAEPRLEVLFERDRIARRVAELGEQVRQRLEGESDILMVALLRGAVFFFVDLVRAMGDPDARLEFVRASSYADSGTRANTTVSSGKIILDQTALDACKGRRVVLVDDIVDTGLTLHTLDRQMRDRGATDVITVVLLDKKSRRTVDYQPGFVGFEVPDHFVVGYGLDCAGQYRTLADICILHPEG